MDSIQNISRYSKHFVNSVIIIVAYFSYDYTEIANTLPVIK